MMKIHVDKNKLAHVDYINNLIKLTDGTLTFQRPEASQLGVFS
jgi:hypothetical protein